MAKLRLSHHLKGYFSGYAYLSVIPLYLLFRIYLSIFYYRPECSRYLIKLKFEVPVGIVSGSLRADRAIVLSDEMIKFALA